MNSLPPNCTDEAELQRKTEPTQNKTQSALSQETLSFQFRLLSREQPAIYPTLTLTGDDNLAPMGQEERCRDVGNGLRMRIVTNNERMCHAA